MSDPFHLGGWGMYPTTVAGLILIAAAIQYARRPEPRRMHLVRALSFLTFLTGSLGFITGVIKSFIAAGQAAQESGNLALIGVGESLNNLGLAFSTMIVAWICVAIGAARCTPNQSGAELTDPHRPS